jgi:sugar lactone lactonase YvrE
MRPLSIAIAVAVAILAVAAGLRAPIATAATDSAYRLDSFPCGGRRGGGQTDAAGNLYVPCLFQNGVTRPHIAVFNASGARTATIYTDVYYSDVAPSPDGSFLYVMTFSSKNARRLDRQLDGTYRTNASWRPQNFPMWGGSYTPLGEFIATDDTGNIYISSGTWTDAPNAIVKYAPNGSYITSFGDYLETWDLNFFYWVNAGIGVSPDGASVYVAEVGNNRVQRFDRQGDGSYRGTFAMGNDPTLDANPRDGWCGDDDRAARLAAPYDIGLDAQGTIYIINSTCWEVKRFSSTGVALGTQILPNVYSEHVHGLAVDRSGRIYIPEADRIMRLAGETTPVPVTPQPHWIATTYTGWAFATAKAPATTVATWRWTSTGWVAASFRSGTKVWTQPFSGTWMWTWANSTWYATQVAYLAK